MTSTEIALLLNSNSEKITRIGEIIGKKIEEKDNFENLNEFEKTFILIDVLEHNVTNGGFVLATLVTNLLTELLRTLLVVLTSFTTPFFHFVFHLIS